MPHILLVEDDAALAALIVDYLRAKGYQLSHLSRGDEVLPWLRQQRADLLLLDLMLPGLDGFSVCRLVRGISNLPVLMLTARNQHLDQIDGLESGADDYVVKPVEPRVLLARIQALLRRAQPAPLAELTRGQLHLQRSCRRATLGGQPLELTHSEFELLWLLAEHAGQAVSRDTMLQYLRGIEFDGLDRSADVVVSRLRRKLGDHPKSPEKIKTVWCQGYMLLPEVSA
ncbi:response regulator transcription factor [Chitinibacter tainanensis]|uniref:response regulator transcription factor n=1 Tax=Chitinibacter tainanensis TaxID=230667 RepID=UPI0023547821|nr:response regulator transcription factor [Chitinibacter tainanensis]